MSISGQTGTPETRSTNARVPGAKSSRVAVSTSLDEPVVLFEDNHLIAVQKPAGWQSQPSDSDAPDVFSWVKAYLKQKYQKPGNVFLGIVHRLDLPVEGVLLFARTSKAASRLSESIRTRAVEKVYLAWVENEMPAMASDWVAYLSIEADPTVKVAEASFEGSARAEMQVRVVDVLPGRTLVEIHLGTGRKHQIRAMLAAKGFPILGDSRYGASSKQGLQWGQEIGLLAASLAFEHPTQKTPIKISAEISGWMDSWRTYRA